MREISGRSKRGSQVEFVVSFILFVTFIVFMYVLLVSKVDIGQSKKNSVENVEANIISMVSDNLTKTSVSVNSVQNSNCFIFSGLANTLSLGNNLFAQNDTGVNFSVYSDGNSISIDSPSNFFRIYYSPEFNPSPGILGGCKTLSPTDYAIGITKNQSYIFETKILQIFDNYTANYTKVKNQVTIFPGDDFGLKFVYQNGTVINTTETASSVNIYADRIPIQYVNSTSEIQSGYLEIDVW